MMRRIAPMLLAACLACAAAPASAEQLVVALSNPHVAINSNFIGENLVLFGTVAPDPGMSTRPGGYDLVITVSGPRVTLRTRRKARVLGIWVNVDSSEFVRVPSFLAILSNRPVQAIAPPETLRRLQIGLDYYLLPQHIGPDIADTVRDDPFRVAFVRQQSQHDFYLESPNAVTYLTPAVFRAAIALPANVPVGNYAIDAKLFANGAMIATATTTLEVTKAGVEQYVAEAATNYGLLYGLATALMALFTGWVASAVFRRD